MQRARGKELTRRNRGSAAGSPKGLATMGNEGIQQMDTDTDLYKRIRREVDLIPIADAHDHIMERKDTLAREVDLFDLFDRTYVKGDFVSAGMPADAWVREEFDPEEGWRRIRPYLDRVRNTSYYRALIGAFHDLYDFPDGDLSDDNWRALSDKIHDANKREDWYHHVLKEGARIEVSLLHRPDPSVYDTDREFCLPVLWVDPLLYGYTSVLFLENKVQRYVLRYGRDALYEEHGVRASSFDDYLDLIDAVFEKAVQRGVVAAKSVAAYRRTLLYEPAGRSDAETIFLKPDGEITPVEAKVFQDYVMHVLVHKTIEYDLPFQFHTGYQHGFGNFLANSHPLHLNNLIAAYPEARFVLFHGSYPFGGELSVLAKTYANVYLDFNWLPLISPVVAERMLSEWLETVPRSKLEWGGDCQHVEAVYGHVRQMRGVLARVLTDKVLRGDFSEDLAADTAKKLLRDNVWEIYNLDQKRGERTLDW
jgi:predicted TIM-barrel fold metal-dependent hydrolase